MESVSSGAGSSTKNARERLKRNEGPAGDTRTPGRSPVIGMAAEEGERREEGGERERGSPAKDDDFPPRPLPPPRRRHSLPRKIAARDTGTTDPPRTDLR